jgi:hypothetical protein
MLRSAERALIGNSRIGSDVVRERRSPQPRSVFGVRLNSKEIGMMQRRVQLVVVFLALTIAGARTVTAQTDPSVYVRFNVDGWWFCPAVSDNYIYGFLAWANTTGAADSQTTVTGNNIRLVWCQREDVDEWTLWGWSNTSTTPGEGGAWVRSLLDDPEVFSLDPDLAYWIPAFGDGEPSQPKHSRELRESV